MPRSTTTRSTSRLRRWPRDGTGASRESETHFDDTVIALSFSGGGMRAAAFSHGVLTALADTNIRTRGGPVSLIDRVDIISGVSGGAIPAAYFGLKKRAALADFRERFLLRNAEKSLSTDVNITNLSRGFSGGIERLDAISALARRQFVQRRDLRRHEPDAAAARLDQRVRHLQPHAVPVRPRCVRRAVLGLHAVSGVARGRGFGGGAGVLCAGGDPELLRQMPLPLPEWVERVRNNPDSPPMLRQYADAIVRYRKGDVKYVKLLDGGLVDNYGLAGFTISRLLSNTAHGPLSAREGVKLRRVMFMVVDAGRQPSGAWSKTVAGPSGVDLIMATADTATGSSAAQSYTAFSEMMNDWQARLVAWRCRLSATERARLGAGPNWNCRDVKFYVSRVGFEQLGQERAAQLDAVETRFKLPQPGRYGGRRGPRCAKRQHQVPRLRAQPRRQRAVAGGPAPPGTARRAGCRRNHRRFPAGSHGARAAPVAGVT